MNATAKTLTVALLGAIALTCVFVVSSHPITGVANAPWLFRGTGLHDGDTFGNYGIEVDANALERQRGTAKRQHGTERRQGWQRR